MIGFPLSRDIIDIKSMTNDVLAPKNNETYV